MQKKRQPKDIIEEMMNKFVLISKSLLIVSSQDFLEKEKGVYGRLYAKPSRRFAVLLSIDREVLVLFTSFKELQARTIKTAREIINNSLGRLESTVAIIVHQDPSGNSKLKKWGRENGISALPLYYVGEQFPKNEEEFEQILCRELFSFDPFDVTGPVSDDSQFYGRRTEAQDLARQMQMGQVRSCLGIRKIGKTSIINRIINDAKTYHECYCVMIDCSKDHIWKMSACQLLESLSIAIKKAISLIDRYSEVEFVNDEKEISESLESLVVSISSSELPILVFFDETDYITPGSPTAPHWKDDFNIFWRNLRAVYQESSRRNKKFSILLSGVSSKWFCIESIYGIENAALAFIPEEYLSPLPRGASNAMIKTIARTAGLIFDDSNAGPIAQACSDIPFWIRKACSYIHRNIDFYDRPLRPEGSIISTLLKKFIEAEGGSLAQVALIHLFRVYPELESICLHCYNETTTECPKNYLAVLKKYGVIAESNKKYCISGDMMKEGLKLYLEINNNVETKTIENNMQSHAKLEIESLDDWADELAIINKRRNLLEKRLRSIVLNFIRFDALQNSQKATIKERILKIIESNSRARFSHLSPEQIIEKLFWTDITKLITKEWNLFEKVFHDKTLFSLNCSIVNDRPDAHAKEVDGADMALYRRSLKWLEDSISSL